MTKTVQIRPSIEFLRLLTFLGVGWNIAPSGNGDTPSVLVELDEETDIRLLRIWEELTELRYAYLAVHPTQLVLWEEDDDG